MTRHLPDQATQVQGALGTSLEGPDETGKDYRLNGCLKADKDGFSLQEC